MIKVAVTDYGFTDELAVERQILEPLGCTVVGIHGKTTEELINVTRDADYVITQFAKVNADVINAMQKSKIIVRYGVGVDNVDLDAAAKKGIPVCNVPDYCIDEVADQTLSFILSLTRRVTVLNSYVHGGKWGLPFSFEKILCLKGMTVGLVAFGKISREVALRLKPFKANILVFDPGVDAAVIKEHGCTPATLDELYAKSDIISLHCPSNAKTRLMINADSMGKMKKGVILVNTSRGDLVKTEDLIDALKSGQVDSVALDVTNPEPINPDNPLLTMDNVIITPHMASVSPVAPTMLRQKVAQTVVCAMEGKKLPNVVNGVVK